MQKKTNADGKARLCLVCHTHLLRASEKCPHCGHLSSSEEGEPKGSVFGRWGNKRSALLAASLVGLTALWGCPGTNTLDGAKQEIREEAIIQPPYGLPASEFVQDGGGSEPSSEK